MGFLIRVQVSKSPSKRHCGRVIEWILTRPFCLDLQTPRTLRNMV